jgi:hypothetical protein
MKTNTASLSVICILVIAALLVIGSLRIQQAHAQVATSSALAASSTDTTSATDATTSIVASATTTPSTDAQIATTTSGLVAPAETPPQGLTEVHIIGTKYIDYFTDGTTITEYPGDPNVDSHLSEKDAPIPARDGLKWHHTIGRFLYDTPSGDLEVGDYATQPNGTYIENAPPFVSSTSTPAVSDGTTPPAPTSDTTSTSSSIPQTDSPSTTEQSTTSTPATDTTATTTS